MRMVASQSMTGSSPPPAAGEGDAATWAAAKTFRQAGGRYPAAQPGSGMTSGPDSGTRPGSWIWAVISDRQRRHVEPSACGGGLQRQVGQLHPLGPFDQVPGERAALTGALQEQLPLHLEPVVEGHVVRHVRPQL